MGVAVMNAPQTQAAFNLASPLAARRPRVIVATRNAGRIAAENSDAFVIDHEAVRVWHGAEWVSLSKSGARGQLFAFCAATLCAGGGFLDRDDLHECLFGCDANGGPDYSERIIDRIACISKPFLRWAGLRLRAEKGHRRYAVSWSPQREKAAAPFRVLSGAAPRVEAA